MGNSNGLGVSKAQIFKEKYMRLTWNLLGVWRGLNQKTLVGEACFFLFPEPAIYFGQHQERDSGHD